MNVVAQMMVRNEEDVIFETLEEIARWGVETIVILDGESTDGTADVIEKFARNRSMLTVDLFVIPDPPGRWHNHQRQVLLDLTREYAPDWILSVDADEIYDTSPVDAILAAESVGANVVWCDVPQFWITYADLRAGLLVEDRSVSVQQRRRWYSWGHTGVFIWRDLPGHYYRGIETIKRTPELPGLTWREWQRPGPVRPICKHYCFRSLEQSMKRMVERLPRDGRRCFGKYYLDWIIDEQEVGLHHFTGEWDRRRNHEAVVAWLGRHLG